MPQEEIKKQKRAVALKYDVQTQAIPKILAKGKGGIADKIMEVARENGIPLYHDPELVDILSQLEIGNQISPELYQAVAEVLIFIYKMNQRKMEKFKKDNVDLKKDLQEIPRSSSTE